MAEISQEDRDKLARSIAEALSTVGMSIVAPDPSKESRSKWKIVFSVSFEPA